MAINTTGQNLIDGAKRYVPEMQSSSHDTSLLAFINHERRFLLGKKQTMVEEIHLSAALDDIVADQLLYQLPNDFVRIKKVMRQNSDGDFKLCAHVDRQQFRIWEDEGKIYGDDGQFYYALRGNHIDLRGTPAASITDGLRIDYWYLPDEWAVGDTIDQFWELFREILEVGAALRTGIRREDDRKELERHYDGRLLPHYLSNFGQRAAEPMRMKDYRTTRRSAAGRGRFGRIG